MTRFYLQDFLWLSRGHVEQLALAVGMRVRPGQHLQRDLLVDGEEWLFVTSWAVHPEGSQPVRAISLDRWVGTSWRVIEYRDDFDD